MEDFICYPYMVACLVIAFENTLPYIVDLQCNVNFLSIDYGDDEYQNSPSPGYSGDQERPENFQWPLLPSHPESDARL
jgi:hypothetical protein